MKVVICGIPYTVQFKRDHFDSDTHFGQVDFKRSEITINSEVSVAVQRETLCHEILHAILIHIGREDLSIDEQLVTVLSNAINTIFMPRIDWELEDN